MYPLDEFISLVMLSLTRFFFLLPFFIPMPVHNSAKTSSYLIPHEGELLGLEDNTKYRSMSWCIAVFNSHKT
jgi:hypothetical protein